MVVNRFLKLNTNWAGVEWVAKMSDGGKLAWLAIQNHTKANGMGGVVLSVSAWVLRQQHFLSSEECVEEAIREAKKHNALRCDGDKWVLLKWSEEQGDETGADRQKKWRDSKKKPEEPKVASDSEERNALRNAGNGEEKRREESNKGDKPPREEALCDYLPEEMRTPEVCEAWDGFVSYRVERKLSKYRPTAIRTMAKLIVDAGCGATEVVEGLRGIIGANWQGPPTGYWERMKSQPAARTTALARERPSMDDKNDAMTIEAFDRMLARNEISQEQYDSARATYAKR